MQNAYDWIRRCRSGVELLAILRMLRHDPRCFERIHAVAGQDQVGPPPYALSTPCLRCWFYPRLPGDNYCYTCQQIRVGTHNLDTLSRTSLIVWGYVNQLPKQLRSDGRFYDVEIPGSYVHDDHHFLLMVRQRDLQAWLRELAMYHGTELKGHLQVFPSQGDRTEGRWLGELLCHVIRHEAYFPLDKLRVRFYRRAYQVLRPHEFDQEGLLTHEISEFLGLMEMAVIFRSYLKPEEQETLYELLKAKDEAEGIFLWGRFVGMLNPAARDLLDSWELRKWSAARIQFFYQLAEYVEFRFLD